jgi:hypothetical protein
MAKKPEWWQMLGSPEKMIERYAFTAVVLIVLIALSLGDIFFNIFEDKILKILTYLSCASGPLDSRHCGADRAGGALGTAEGPAGLFPEGLRRGLPGGGGAAAEGPGASSCHRDRPHQPAGSPLAGRRGIP